MGKKKQTISLVLFLAIIIGSFAFFAKGQFNQPASAEVDFFIDWSTTTFVPYEYSGKALPAYGSTIILSATPLLPINENDYSYVWAIDSSFSPNNNGKPIADFSAKKTAGGSHSVILTIYNKKTMKSVKETSLSIPVSKPQSIIYKELDGGIYYPLNAENMVEVGGQMSLLAQPFYFNAAAGQSLRYQWKLNGQKIEGNVSEPNKLVVSFPDKIPAGTRYDLSLSIDNPFDTFQSAVKTYRITVK